MPTTYTDLIADWQRNFSTYINVYQTGQQSFIPNLLPETAVQFSVHQTLDILHKRLGNNLLRRALDPQETIDSPVGREPDASWLNRSNMVGVNVRTIGSFWNVVNYVLTLPASHDSIHLLPIWEPGVVGSLYGMVSWQINPEFYSQELTQFIPALNTVEKQLKVVVNLLHAMGRTVGLDVIPHTDRFSEMVLAYPSFFEWVRREGPWLVDHTDKVYLLVEEAIWEFILTREPADNSPVLYTKEMFFSPTIPFVSDEQRHRVLFGEPSDYSGRLQRRIQLIQHLVSYGFETLPMTMAPPYRGIHINPDEFVVDEYGQIWYQYEFDKPQAMSRVFGPLTRYRFYFSNDNNRHWELNFNQPNVTAWEYFCRKYCECQQQYCFDFMRGDMAHVQMRSEGVPDDPDDYYDPLRAVKAYVQERGVAYFGFFAETFLAPPNEMGYGDELDHLEAIEADSTLGDLQSSVVGSPEFVQRFRDYYRWLKTRQVAPNFTVMTADKDDPRFDLFYRTGNLFRYFVALFLTDMPSYVGLGFEVRDQHEQRAANEEYTKLYVFQVTDDEEKDKVTHGSYRWGQNAGQFAAITRMRQFAETIWPAIAGQQTRWIVPPSLQTSYIAWTQAETPQYAFAAAMTGALPERIAEIPDDSVVFDGEGCRVYRLS
ncbi:hypothetical protein GCM10023189_33720 [Nibrella saemangeumensis]|uniref:Uncharacterized protein n=1 Tax=Nibrella saemangeumensis TaxID=1084526 RepID=A0ABP8N508_9BACT